MDAALVREIRFTARHRYGIVGHSHEENRQRFGAQAESHEHEWTIRVEVRGPMDPQTGFVTDLALLDGLLGRLFRGWDGGDLNELIADVKDGRMQPSTESLARWIHDRVGPEISPPARVGRVHVWESPSLGAYYPARPVAS